MLMSIIFKQFLPLQSKNSPELDAQEIIPHSCILIECPHSFTSLEQRNIYASQIALALSLELIPLLAPEGSIADLSLYASYIWPLQESSFHFNQNANRLSSFLVQMNIQFTRSHNSLIGLFTSGTTGKPKLIWHTLQNYIHSAQRSAKLLNLETHSKVLSALPCYHNGGFLNLVRFDLFPHELNICSHKELQDQWDQITPDIIIGVPTQLQQALSSKIIKEGQTFYCGGAALNEQLWQKALDQNVEVIGTYGLTESCGAILFKQSPTDLYSPMQAVKVSSNSNNQLCFESNSNALAYQQEKNLHFYKTPLETADLIEIDSQGRIQIKGRSDQIIICSGENIDPLEISHCAQTYLSEHKILSQIQVLPLKDEVKGQIPILIVNGINSWTDQKREAFIQYLREKISPLKRPRFILDYSTPEKGIKLTSEDITHVFSNPELKKWKV